MTPVPWPAPRFTVRDFPALADPSALLEEFLPPMLELLDRPHAVDLPDRLLELRSRLDEIFADGGWTGDESRVAFDLLLAFADSQHA